MQFFDETEALREAWLRRSQEFDCVQLRWTVDVQVQKEFYRSFQTVKPRVPPEDLAFSGLMRSISLSGDMVRWQAHSMFVGEQLELLDQLIVDDGERYVLLVANRDATVVHRGAARGNVYRSPGYPKATVPMMVFFRPLNPSFGGNREPVIESIDAEGMCVVSFGRYRITVDSQRDFVPVVADKYFKNGRLMARHKMEFALKGGRWILSGWSATKWPSFEQMSKTETSKVVSLETERTAQSDFRFVFPRGTRFYDGAEYIALGDGVNRVITDEERQQDLSNAQLLNSP